MGNNHGCKTIRIIFLVASNKKCARESVTFRLKKHALKNMDDEDINNNFIGVFPSNHMNKFINQAAMSEKSGKYPFIIINIDSSHKGGTRWWSILDMEPKTDIFFFDLFGLDGLKHFIIQDDRKIIGKILLGSE